MFCPECGSENDLEKGYCRRCGKSLASVRLAVGGSVEEAAKAVKGEERPIVYRGRIVVGLLLILIAIATIVTSGRFGFSNIQITSFIVIIMVLVFLRLARKSHRVARALNTDASRLNLRASAAAKAPGLNVLTKSLDLQEPASNRSVTEQDTIKLKS